MIPAKPQQEDEDGNIILLEMPEYCQVQGHIDPIDPEAPPINFNVNLPVNWNQKGMQVGGGGFNGSVVTLFPNGKGSSYMDPQPLDDPYPITKGYVTFGGDSGHTGGNAIFTLNDEALHNFGYAALKKTHDVAVEIIKEAYGKAPKYMYFDGESNGGHEALMVAQRFPEDYDAIIAVSPVLSWEFQNTGIVRYRTALIEGGWMNEDEIKTLADATRAQCDELDGLADGIIAKYDGCYMNPDVIRCPDGLDSGDDCLSDAQIQMVHTIREPWSLPFPLTNRVTRWPGFGVTGNEDHPTQWVAWHIGSVPPSNPLPPGGTGAEPGLGRLTNFGAMWMRYAVAQDENFDPYRFYAPEYKDRLQYLSSVTDATNPDLWGLYKNGGKLIIVQHSADNAVPTRMVAEYYNSVVAKLGKKKVDKFVRFFMTHGAGHDAQAGPGKIDALGIMEDWVEHNVTPPKSPPAFLMDPNTYEVLQSMPACLYPKYAHYNGVGDPNEASSFTCTDREDPLKFNP